MPTVQHPEDAPFLVRLDDQAGLNKSSVTFALGAARTAITVKAQ
jgi:hypothetical protein